MSFKRLNLVPSGAPGFIIAVQYWPGDEARALRLARLLAAIEQRPRRDQVTVALCRRWDMPQPSIQAQTTAEQLGEKFGAMMIRSERKGEGHPAGANGLWAGTFEKLSEFWSLGKTQASWVMFVESDGCPLVPDWIDRIRIENARALALGKRIVGAEMHGVTHAVHINGTLTAHLSVWQDRPSLHRTPDDQAWDIFHRAAIRQEALPSFVIQNAYGAEAWSAQALVGVGRQSAWLASTKDDSAIDWAERTLPAAAEELEEDRKDRERRPW